MLVLFEGSVEGAGGGGLDCRDQVEGLGLELEWGLAWDPGVAWRPLGTLDRALELLWHLPYTLLRGIHGYQWPFLGLLGRPFRAAL